MTGKPIEQILAEEAERFEREKDIPRHYVRGRPPLPEQERGQVYAIRLPAEKLERFRALAAREGKPATALMREWILERLEREGRREDGRLTGRRRRP